MNEPLKLLTTRQHKIVLVVANLFFTVRHAQFRSLATSVAMRQGKPAFKGCQLLLTCKKCLPSIKQFAS
jgi:hypothetical protein